LTAAFARGLPATAMGRGGARCDDATVRRRGLISVALTRPAKCRKARVSGGGRRGPVEHPVNEDEYDRRHRRARLGECRQPVWAWRWAAWARFMPLLHKKFQRPWNLIRYVGLVDVGGFWNSKTASFRLLTAAPYPGRRFSFSCRLGVVAARCLAKGDIGSFPPLRMRADRRASRLVRRLFFFLDDAYPLAEKRSPRRVPP